MQRHILYSFDPDDANLERLKRLRAILRPHMTDHEVGDAGDPNHKAYRAIGRIFAGHFSEIDVDRLRDYAALLVARGRDELDRLEAERGRREKANAPVAAIDGQIAKLRSEIPEAIELSESFIEDFESGMNVDRAEGCRF